MSGEFSSSVGTDMSVQLRKDVGSLKQMFVVAVFLDGCHREAAPCNQWYTKQAMLQAEK